VVLRYLLRAVLIRLALALPALTAIYLAFYLADQGRLLAADLGWARALWAALLHLPLALVQMMPVALLVAAALALSTLRQRGELEALATFGCSPARLCAPVLAAGLVAALLTLALDEAVVPPCEQAIDRLRGAAGASALTGLGAPPAWYEQGAWFYNVEGGRLLALEVDQRFRATRRVEGRITAGQLAGASVVDLRSGSLQRRPVARLALPGLDRLAPLWERPALRAEAMDLASLRRRLRQLRQAGHERSAERLVFHTKLAFPLVSLAMALMACAFALGHRPAAPIRDLAAAVGLALASWALLATGWALARGGWISPVAGVWGPLAAALCLGGGLVARRLRRACPP
jgi:lipopolysaccharide export LptBFGC system permease protein LptF